MLAMTTSDGKVLYPVLQFAGRDLIAGLADVLGVFRDVPVDGWTLASWLVSPSPDLDGMSVLDWLRVNRKVSAAQALAKATAARWSQ